MTMLAIGKHRQNRVKSTKRHIDLRTGRRCGQKMRERLGKTAAKNSDAPKERKKNQRTRRRIRWRPIDEPSERTCQEKSNESNGDKIVREEKRRRKWVTQSGDSAKIRSMATQRARKKRDGKGQQGNGGDVRTGKSLVRVGDGVGTTRTVKKSTFWLPIDVITKIRMTKKQRASFCCLRKNNNIDERAPICALDKGQCIEKQRPSSFGKKRAEAEKKRKGYSD